MQHFSSATPDSRPVAALSIAGSDSGGGAGIQADLRTFSAFRVHGLTAIAALTAQNTRGVTAIHACPIDDLAAQIDAVFDDFRIGAVKIGMLATRDVIACVAERLRRHQPPAIVLDPVMIATSGAALLRPDALQALVGELLPLATVITPNLPEAAALLGRETIARDAMASAAAALRARGVAAVLLKGGHLPDGDVEDLLDAGGEVARYVHPRLPLEAHGTGCTLSSAIAALLALGRPLREACALACDYVHGALRAGSRPGRSELVVLDHFWRMYG